MSESHSTKQNRVFQFSYGYGIEVRVMLRFAAGEGERFYDIQGGRGGE